MYMYMYLQTERFTNTLITCTYMYSDKHTSTHIPSACTCRCIYQNHTHENSTGVNFLHIQNHNG